MKKKLYSVIIPHYNNTQTLGRLLDSIPNRDDIQVIVVDDYSKEDERKKLKEFSHNNLELFLQNENRGGGYARNIGLSKAVGKWLLFADADDYFVENAFEIFDNYKDESFDWLCFCAISADSITGERGVRYITSDHNVRKYIENPTEKNLFFAKYRNYACWNRMISREFIHKYKIVFEECMVHNDVYFAYQIGYFGQKVKFISDELYCCTYSTNSLTFRRRSVERQFLFYISKRKSYWFLKRLGVNKIPISHNNVVYYLYIVKIRGIRFAIKFYKYVWTHRKDLKDARTAYIDIFDRKSI